MPSHEKALLAAGSSDQEAVNVDEVVGLLEANKSLGVAMQVTKEQCDGRSYGLEVHLNT